VGVRGTKEAVRVELGQDVLLRRVQVPAVSSQHSSLGELDFLQYGSTR
jgi:hypothetical protein